MRFSLKRRPRKGVDEYVPNLPYAVSLRQRRKEDGSRAYTWRDIASHTNFRSVPECIVAVTVQLDELEAWLIEQGNAQRDAMAGDGS